MLLKKEFLVLMALAGASWMVRNAPIYDEDYYGAVDARQYEPESDYSAYTGGVEKRSYLDQDSPLLDERQYYEPQLAQPSYAPQEQYQYPSLEKRQDDSDDRDEDIEGRDDDDDDELAERADGDDDDDDD